ncbi:MAG TPA: TolC family protein [Candidatus Binatia bacterium]|jgi:outer membrane protein|nr:TolC family protein [Candidatus Binatia bacterium]
MWFARSLLAAAFFCPALTLRPETLPAATPSTVGLTLPDLRQRVLQRNETLQGRLLGYEAQRSRARAEYGVFEPDLFGSFTHEVNNRKNTAQQQTELLGAATFNETNNNYESGLETLVPSGARVRLGYTLRDLENNLQPARGATNGEYQTFFGLTVTQPLLKNFGAAVTMAGIRLAAISNKMAFQEYRRDLMAVVSAAEATYWNLYLAQEQVRFFEESVKTAESILRDNRARLETGKGSELEVLEAEAGLGLRQAKLTEAQQKQVEAVNRLLSLYAQEAPADGLAVRALDVPQIPGELPEYQALRQAVFNLNPDYLIAREKVQQDLVRVGVARNQRLPALDLKGSYGLNGLGNTPGLSWTDVERQTEPSWYIGAEFHIPLGGGIKSRNELIATRLELDSSEVALRSLQLEILNSLNTAWRKIQSTRGSVAKYQTAVKYNLNVLDAALTRLEAGKIESRKVLEIEADLLESRVSVVESLVHCQLALLELEMIHGVFLERRHLEVTQGDLQLATVHLGRSRTLGDQEYRKGMDDAARLRGQPEAQEDPRFSNLPLK